MASHPSILSPQENQGLWDANFLKTSRPKSCQALTPSTCHLDLRTELAWSRGSRASGVQRHFPSKKSVVFFPKGSTQIYIGDRWWFQIWFLSSPTWGNDPIGLIFFRWVEKSDMSFWCLVKKKNLRQIYLGKPKSRPRPTSLYTPEN